MAFLQWPGPVPPAGTFDRLGVVADSIAELYAKLSGPAVKAFGTLPPLPAERDPLTGAQRLAAAMARHLGIGDARVIVGFSALGGHVGEVELGPGPEYFVTLSARYQDDPRDIPAVLAHEVTHVFLHRHGLRHADLARHEILTDTATLYLGLGRPMLAAYRVDVTQGRYTRRRTTSRVGYLSPPEMGYVLAKRALAFGEEVRPFPGPAAEAYRLGRSRALADYARPPLSGASRAARARYRQDRDHHRPAADYRFDGAKVAFACPACGHGTRLPVGRSVRARCPVCRSVFGCET
ncbi:hypothetical protein [Amycolatopsis sp. cmx-4-83]|uniref:hypothetical protein n=1 Tax=Amycolatopsis sp. cmx-4-83 TaxID=2790940 RepID=UPI00397AC2CE